MKGSKRKTKSRSTNVSVGHTWVPRGLIRSTGPQIYAIVNPMKLCHKYWLMPPLRPADVITAEARSPLFLLFFLSLSPVTPFRSHPLPFVLERDSVPGVYFVARQRRATTPFLFFFPPACCVSTTPESGMRGHPFLSTYFSGCPARLSLSRFKSIRES